MDFTVHAKLLEMQVEAGVVPSAGLFVSGNLGICLGVCGKLELKGYIMELGFPTRAVIGFSKFPLDVG
jgi:hypothetical protein